MRKRHSNYFLGFVMALLLGFFLWHAFFYLQLGLPTASSEWAAKLFESKSLLASRYSGERLFIVAGSNVHFSVDAEKMSKELGLPVINFGTFGGLDAAYFLYRAKKLLRKGDTVLLPIEYGYYSNNQPYNKVFVDHIVARDPAYFRSLPLLDQLKIATEISVKRLITAYGAYFKSSVPSASPLNLYSTYLNAYGDTHSSNRIFMNEDTHALRESAAIEPALFNISENGRIWFILGQFASWCKENGIRLVATAPTHRYYKELENKSIQTNLKKIQEGYARIGVPFIGDPYLAMFDKTFYLDTIYHTNELGKILYTNFLIQAIKKEVPQLSQNPAYFKVVDTSDKNPLDQLLVKFNGWEGVKGIGAFEGPYPAAKLPIVAWGANQIILQFQTAKTQTILFSTEFLLNKDKEDISIKIDDDLVWQQQIVKNDEFYQLKLNLPLEAGIHTLKIESKTNSDLAQSNNQSLLFKSLLVKPQKA